MKCLIALGLAALVLQAGAAERFALADVRLGAGPFLEAQETDRRYLMSLDPDKLLAPFRREAGLPLKTESYGNWESSGLDGHMGGHYLSALAMMAASTGAEEVRARLDYMVAELKKCQRADGYLGGIPDGAQAWQDIRAGKVQADNFTVNGKWVPWYNLHKTYAGLRDAWRYAGNQDARAMLIKMADWAEQLVAGLSPQQMEAMLRSEHGGMNEVLADVYQMTGERRYLDLAQKFSHRALLDPLLQGQDRLDGLHANTQIPKVIGFERIAQLGGDANWHRAAETFWTTVRERRTVAIGGNSVKEHFHGQSDFAPMIHEVEGPETCNTYNMLRLSELLFLRQPQRRYVDYVERALYNHILAAQRPGGGFAYFTPMRPNHYRVYSQPEQGMWCCVGSGLESHAKHGEFIYAHDGADLYVNLFIASTLQWRARGLSITQATRFPDRSSTRLTVGGNGRFTLRIRQPAWAHGMRIRVNGKPVRFAAGDYASIARDWRDGDRVDVTLPMRTTLEQMPDKSDYYAVLHGPIVLAAKTTLFADEKLDVLADGSRMGHIAQGAVCAPEAAPMFVSDTRQFAASFKPVKGAALTFTAPGLINGGQGGALRLIPFFRLHDSRYMIYWPYATPDGLRAVRAQAARAAAERLALDALTIDQVAPGEQQPESDHGYTGEGGDSGLNNGMRWRHATGWFGYVLNDPRREATTLRLGFSTRDAGRSFDIEVNGAIIATVKLDANAPQEIYTRDFALPAGLQADKLAVRFVAHPGSVAGGLYSLRLLRAAPP